MSNRLFIGICMLASALWFTGCAQNAPVGKYAWEKKKPFVISQERQRSTMKSYCVLGKTYTPAYVEVGDSMDGVASWYGPDFHGKYTSSGEVYNMYDFTAAHKTWPMDTVVKITNLDNGKTQTARINDRGPFKDDRIIDCSYATGKALGLDRTGLAKVKIEAISFTGKPLKPTFDMHIDSTIAVNSPAVNSPKKILLDNFGIQVGAFRIEQGALKTKDRYASLDPKYKSIVKRFDMGDGGVLYRVFVMGFISEEEAKNYMACHGITGAIIIRG